MSRLSTFASNEEQLKCAINAGVDHLILEDSRLSIRCHENQHENSSFKRVNDLAKLAKEENANITLSLNIDMMVHHHHITTIQEALTTIQDGPISTIRIQDPGLIVFLAQHHPNFDIHLSTETSNNNQKSVQYYKSLGVTQQTLTNECPTSTITDIQSHCDTNLEIQVQGPLLIQYSLRRYMSDSQKFNSTSQIIKKWAEDLDLPKRYFTFLETTHGHFMLAQFDRCLALHHAQLQALGLNSWLIDARGESLNYLRQSLQGYSAINNNQPIAIAEFTKSLTEESKRPQKAGFFIANKTDSDWRDFKHTTDKHLLGRIIDAKRGQHILVDVVRSFRNTDKLCLITPEAKTIEMKHCEIYSMDKSSLNEAHPLTLVQLPWVKGSVVGSKLALSQQNT